MSDGNNAGISWANDPVWQPVRLVVARPCTGEGDWISSDEEPGDWLKSWVRSESPEHAMKQRGWLPRFGNGGVVRLAPERVLINCDNQPGLAAGCRNHHGGC